ncbi:hypothetical protein DWF00_16630 [Bosea caraganae]|uniref:Uncharacterized protein n=1 Tax=Bosea caraganae TaxID=2763117 RepID=A0A370KYT2_9HYPH|nr:hypothetical protein [Bosea caraganae]RDJ20135.1 hypothetical protein DWE98_26235 [Bosea caraganae]RDJ24847.1 hypothetical protein DWF00_16630 [Bosea caraganae]
MTRKPSRVFVVSRIRDVIVSADPSEGALIGMEVPGEADIELRLPADALAKLEALLANANMEQAKFQKMQ